MSDPTTPADTELQALKVAYPGWFIARAAFGGYQARWRSESGLQIREVHGVTVADLHRRLEIIEAARGESDA